jgi:ring-1,2-phenylacetyl-CoA epoxidase subunit PaaE
MSASFHTLRIAEIVPETADAKSIRFDVPEELRGAFAFRPGQHLTLKADIQGEDVRRNYSLCVAPQDGQLKVTVKRIAGGIFSNWANDNLKPGDAVEVMEPHGSFTWDFRPDARNHYAGFAGGSGITPVMSLLKTALLSEPDSKFTLFYGNRDSQSVIFLEELAALKNRFMDRLQIHHFLAEEAEDIELFNGMLDRTKCDLILGSLIEPEEIGAFFICGPGPMMDAAEEALKEVGVPPERILVERFTAGRPDAGAADAGGGPRHDRHPRRPHPPGAVQCAGRQHPRQRTHRGHARALRLQGRRLRHLPRPRHQGRGRDGRPLRPERRGNSRRLRPYLPVGAQGRGGRSGLRRLNGG